MFRPNISAQLHRRQTKRSVHGKTLYALPVPVRLAVVTLNDEVQPSTVRADSSASRGAAYIEVLQAKLLLPPNVQVTEGDVIEVLGRLVEVNGIFPRTNLTGRLDHLEVSGDMKAEL